MSKASEAAKEYKHSEEYTDYEFDGEDEYPVTVSPSADVAFLAGVKWAVEQMRFSPMMEDKDGHGYVKFADLVALLEDEKK